MHESQAISQNSHAMLQAVESLLAMIQRLEAQAAEIRYGYRRWLDGMLGELQDQSEGWMFSLKNKFGFSKKEAEKLFYDYRKKDEPDDPNQDPSANEPKSTDEKISMIMDYMKETSSKLDRIEDDIAHLKSQVEAILQKI